MREKEEQNFEFIQNGMVFISNEHQRFLHNIPVEGLQKCSRTIVIKENKDGCRGYDIDPGDGFIVKIINNDTKSDQMSEKPMRVYQADDDMIELRGFPLRAMTPFGWQTIDYSDYGLTLHFENDVWKKCCLHLLDRDVVIEYRHTNSQEKNSETVIEHNIIPEDEELDRCTGHPARPNEIELCREKQRTYYKAYYRCPDYHKKIAYYIHDDEIGNNPFSSKAALCKQDCLFPTCPFYDFWSVNNRFNAHCGHLSDYDEWVVEGYKKRFE